MDQEKLAVGISFMRRSLATSAVALALAAIWSVEAAAQHGQTVWDGVYTDAQAIRGETAYYEVCAACHGDDLAGGSGRPLTGNTFMDDWREGSLESLYDAIRTMPPGGGSLGERTYLDILTYLLWYNGFPEGNRALTARNLDRIRIEGPNGPQPLPDRAAVRVVGCLAREEGGDWLLRMAAPPDRTRSSDKVTEAELERASDLSLGSFDYRLGNFYMLGAFDPADYEGHKMLVKGSLARDREGDRISLTAMGSIADSCR